MAKASVRTRRGKTTGQILLTAEVERADQSARNFTEASRAVDRDLIKLARGDLSDEATQAMRDVAPVETGLLKEVIEAKVSFGRGQVRVSINSPVVDFDTNYPYTGVTRFGHRQAWIYPKHETQPIFEPGRTTIHGDPQSQFFYEKGHAPTLKVHAKGRYETPIYRSRVRGYQPSGDWVERGLPAANDAAEELGNRVARQIVFRVSND